MRPIAILALLLLSLTLQTLHVAADTVLHYRSSPDYAGNVDERTITPADGYVFTVMNTGTNGVSVTVRSPADYNGYPLGFAAPTGMSLALGDYPLATAYGSDTAPRLQFQFGGGLDTGEFQVLELSYDSNGEVLSLAVNFVDHLDYTKAAYGQLRYNSSVPYLTPAGTGQLDRNFYRVHETAGTLPIHVPRGDGSTGTLTVDYATADGSSVAGRDYTATSGTLTWTDGDTADKIISIPVLNTHDPYRSDGDFTVRLSGAGAGEQTLATVTVVKDDSSVSFIHLDAHVNDVLQSVPESTYSIATGHVLSATASQQDGSFLFGLLNEEFASPAVGYAEPEETLLFAPSYDQLVLPPGDYQGAFSSQSDTAPCLYLGGFDVWNVNGGASFQVLEADYGADGGLVRFAANFTVLNPYAPTTVLRGQIRFNSTVPLPSATLPTVSVAAKTASIHPDGDGPGVFTLTRTGDLSAPLTVTYTVKGTAVNGHDYQTLKGAKTIKAGKASAAVKVKPLASEEAGGGKKTVKLTVQAEELYDVSPSGSTAKVKILPGI